jgi:exodeoxyribonuclease V alpha subunit
MEFIFGKMMQAENLLAYFDPFDTALSEKLLERVKKDFMHVFVAYLSAASRRGHLCVKITDLLQPSPSTLLQSALTPEEEKALSQAIIEGARLLDSEVIEDVKEQIYSTKPLCRNNHHYYFQRNWVYETLILKEWTRFKNDKPTIVLNPVALQEGLSKTSLNQLQREAVLSMAGQSVTCLTGGPGTGKTFTAAYFIEFFLKELEEQKNPLEEALITLSAPTGKATQRLFESVERVITRKGKFVVKTLHSLLKGFQPHQALKYDDDLLLCGELFLIDEASMIDASLMTQLFTAIPKGARVVLLGDPFQLPAIENGALFADLIKREEKREGSTVIRLEKEVRIENSQIQRFAHLLKESPKEVMDFVKESTSGDFQCHFVEKSGAFKNYLSSYVDSLPVLESEALLKSEEATLDALFAFYKKQVLLTPLRKGLWGVDELNSMIQKKIYQKHKERGLIHPIMITVNCERERLNNGDFGLLVCSSTNLPEENYGLFLTQKGPSKFRKIPLPLIPSFEFAYALSIHKSQGSEYNHVDLLIPEGAEVFAKEIFYTAVTRAKKSLTIITHPQTFQTLLYKSEQRVSGLINR